MLELNKYAALEPYLNGRSIEGAWEQFQNSGYVIFESVLTPEELKVQHTALKPWIDAGIRGRNVFEGTESNRIYAMPGKDPIFADLITHPLQLAFAELELGKSCLLSACLAIKLPPRARELCGYSIHEPFMGYVDGVHPDKVLATGKEQ